MATTAKVYLSDALPIEVRGAHRVVYFQDGSVHILDSKNRPVFIGAPGRYAAVVMEYALDETPADEQVSNMPIRRPANAIVPVQPTPEQQEKRPVPPPGFPPVGDSKPAQDSSPGEVKVTSTDEREPDGDTTHEMRIPVRRVKHEDFLVAPLSEKAGRQ